MDYGYNAWKPEVKEQIDKQTLSWKNTRVMALALGTFLNMLRRKNKNNNLRELREDVSKNRRMANQCFYA